MKHHPLLYTLRRNAAAALGSAALVAGLHMATTPAHAAYKPERRVELKGEAKTKLKEVVSLLRDMPNQGRQAIIAQRLGLYFSQDGESKYNGSRNPSSGALFVDTTGATLDWNSVKNSMVPVQWREADDKVQYLGTDAVLPSFTKEVTSLIYATAKSIISSMPEVLRDAVLAEEGSLLYSTSGKKAYSSREKISYTNEGLVQRKRDFAVPSSELRFKDSEGYERAYSKVMSEHEKEWKLRCDIFARCIQYTSRKEILALFPNELNALRKSKASSTTKVAQDTPSAQDSTPSGRTAMGDTTAPKPPADIKGDTKSAPQTVTAMGNTQAPQQPAATPATPQVTATLSTSASGKVATHLPKAPPAVPAPSSSDAPTVAALKKMPIRVREAWLAEWMGLCFMPDKTASLNDKKEAIKGARYVGTDGKEHDLWEDRQAGAALWSEASQNIDPNYRIGIVREFSAVTKQMAQHNLWFQYWRLSEFMRDAWLAEMGSCLYLPDGSGSAYTATLGASRTESGLRGTFRQFKGESKFRDSKGVEHNMKERNPYWEKGEDKSWNIMHACAALLGTKEVAVVMAQELATLRKHNPEAAKFPTPIQTPFLEGNPRIEFEEIPYDNNGEPHPGVEHFKKMNPASQEAWLAEKMGLLFMSDGQGAYDKKEGRAGSLYVGSDGKTHDVLNTLKENGYMRNFLRRYDSETEAIIRSVPETSEKVALETAKYILLNAPRLMRDAWLCEVSGMCYVPGSTNDAYRSDSEDVSTVEGKHVYVKLVNPPVAFFTDTTGVEHPVTDRQPYWKELGKKWPALYTCVKYCAPSKIFEAFSAEMAALRKNYTTSTKRPAPASAGTSSASPTSNDGNSAMGRRWF